MDATLQNTSNIISQTNTSKLPQIDAKNIDKVLIYPVYTLNIIELAYILLLSMGVQRLTKQTYTESLKDILSTYFVGLLVWVLGVCFLIVNLS